MLSPDEDFSQAGVNSGIQYAESFKVYKEMLSRDPEDPTFKRIFSHFNASLFSKAPTTSGRVVVDDGNYDIELEQFRNALLADPPVEDVISAGGGKTSPLPSTSVTGAGTNGTSPSTPPLQPDHVSISVTSHISHTIAASSQVSNIVNSSVNLSPELEVRETSPVRETSRVEEISPPIQKKPRALPKKRTPKPAVETPDTNVEDIAPRRRVTRQTKIAPVDPPLEATRKR